VASKVAFTGLPEQAERLRPQIDFNIAQVLDHGQFIMGPEVIQFERKLEAFCGAKHAIAVANGTDALQIALMAAKVGPGDAVYVPSFTYTATAEVILVLGARPVFVDVDPSTFNIDCDDLARKIKATNRGALTPKAIISVDLFGLPADSDALNMIAREHGLFLISDAAQSFGAQNSAGRNVGTLAPVTTTSFFPAKPLGCYGDGGAIFTDDDDLAKAMRSIRVHGQGSAKYETVRVGMNSRLDTLQAAILLAKIDVFAEEIDNRNRLADRYSDALKDVVVVPLKPERTISAWAQYTLRVQHRDIFQEVLSEGGIPTAIYYPLPMHLQPAYREFGCGLGSLPVSEQLSGEVISLPMNPYWTEDDLRRVVEAVHTASIPA
jgi:UDP-2-acetamido-2-deoxy-ribo-hexuluronate aminotransferase